MGPPVVERHVTLDTVKRFFDAECAGPRWEAAFRVQRRHASIKATLLGVTPALGIFLGHAQAHAVVATACRTLDMPAVVPFLDGAADTSAAALAAALLEYALKLDGGEGNEHLLRYLCSAVLQTTRSKATETLCLLVMRLHGAAQ